MWEIKIKFKNTFFILKYDYRDYNRHISRNKNKKDIFFGLKIKKNININICINSKNIFNLFS